ncbi:hypothetical protein D3C77_652440 [compost metagenome]
MKELRLEHENLYLQKLTLEPLFGNPFALDGASTTGDRLPHSVFGNWSDHTYGCDAFPADVRLARSLKLWKMGGAAFRKMALASCAWRVSVYLRYSCQAVGSGHDQSNFPRRCE